jgi:hypothetical protein
MHIIKASKIAYTQREKSNETDLEKNTQTYLEKKNYRVVNPFNLCKPDFVVADSKKI